MNENEAEVASVENVEAAAPPKKKAKAKAKAKVKAKKASSKKAKPAKKAKKAKSSGSLNRGKLYSLRSDVSVEEYDPKTHAGAVIHAIHRLKEATQAQVIEQVTKEKKIVEGMKGGIPQAVRFQIWHLSKRQNILKSKLPAAS